MANAAELLLILKLKDQASKGLRDVAVVGLQGIAMAAGAAAAGALAAGAALTKLAVDAAPLAGIKAAFEGITAGNAEMLDQLRESSGFMVKDTELMKNYNLAAQLVSKTFADDLPEAMGYLQKVSSATGQSMDYMMTSLIRGVGRMSPLILDNLAIQVSLEEATAKAAQMFGKEAEALSKAEQQAGMMNVVMEKLRVNTASMPEVAGTAAAGLGQLAASLGNIKDRIGMALLPALQAILPEVNKLVAGVGPPLERMAFGISAAFITHMPAITAAVQTASQAIGQAFEWVMQVANVVWPFVTTTVQAGMTAIQSAVKLGSAIVRGDWETAWGEIESIVGKAFGLLIGAVQTGLQNIADSHHPFWQWVRDGWNAWAEDIRGAWTWLEDEWHKLLVDFGGGWDKLEKLLFGGTSHVQEYMENTGKAVNSMSDETGGALDRIGKYVAGGIEAWNEYWNAARGKGSTWNPYGATGTPWKGAWGAPSAPTPTMPTMPTMPEMPGGTGGGSTPGSAARERAGETTADIASLIDRMLKDISSIYQTLSTKLPDIVTPVRAFMDRLWQIASEVAAWTTQGGAEMRAFVDWIAKDLQPMWQKWADSMAPIVSLVQAVASISEAAAEKMGDLGASVTEFMDRALAMSREAASWMNKHAALIIPFIEWMDEDLRELYQKWVDSLQPLANLLGVGRQMMETMGEEAKEQKASVAEFFDRIFSVMVDTRRIVEGNAILKAQILAFKDWIEPTVKEWLEAIGSLGQLLQVGRGLIEVTADKLPDAKESVNAFFDRLLSIMDVTRDWIRTKGDGFAKEVAAFKEEIAPALQSWLDGLGPLAGLFGTGLGMMHLMGDKVKKIQIPVAGFLAKLFNFSEIARKWVEDQGPDFTDRMRALGEQIKEPLTLLLDAMKPVEAIMSMLEGFMVPDDDKKAWKANIESVFTEVIRPALDAVIKGLNAIKSQLTNTAALKAAWEGGFSLGAHVGEGIAAGLLSQLGAVLNAAGMLAAAAVPSIGGYSSGGGPPGGDRIGYAPVIASGGGGGVNVNIGELYGSDRTAAEQFGRQVVSEMARQGVRFNR